MLLTKNEPFDIVKVISGGRVVIPRGLRRLLRINDGDYLAVYLEEDSRTVKLEPVMIVPKNESATVQR
jgi:AbrB family looped-hinge helix DNA binding protein